MPGKRRQLCEQPSDSGIFQFGLGRKITGCFYAWQFHICAICAILVDGRRASENRHWGTIRILGGFAQ